MNASEPLKESVFFDYGKYTLTPKSVKQLDQFVKKIHDKKIKTITIIGHTDADGSIEYNAKLSKKRTNIVNDYFTSKQFDPHLIHLKYFGELKPISSNLSLIGKEKNRRVEVIIEFEDEFEISKSFIQQFQHFKINPNKDTILFVNQFNTKINIPANAFVNQNGGKVTTLVDFQYREFRNSAEIAFSKIPMTYQENEQNYYFNSSGMFEIRGFSEGQEIEINPNNKLTIDYALAKKNPEINFFELNDSNERWSKIQTIETQNSTINAVQSDKTEKVILQNDSVFFTARQKIIQENKKESVLKFKQANTFKMKEKFDSTDQINTLLGAGLSFDPGHSYPNIIKGLNIGNFGVFNCDQIYRIPNLVNIQATYTDEKGKPITDIQFLSLIDLKYNGAFSFSPSIFSCNAEGKNVLVLFTKNNDIYIVDELTFKNMNIKQNGKYTFPATNMSSTIKCTNDLSKYLGI